MDKTYSVFSAGLGVTLRTGYNSQINLDLIREVIERNQGAEYEVSYKTVLADAERGRYAVECSITAKTVPPVCINRLGEIQAGQNDTEPLTEAYEKAFYMAASDLLKLYTLPETVEQEKTEGTYDSSLPDDLDIDFDIPSFDIPDFSIPSFSSENNLSDDEIILMGNLKGCKVGDVKGTAQFDHFLAQIQKCEGLVFPDQERNEQLARFRLFRKEETLCASL